MLQDLLRSIMTPLRFQHVSRQNVESQVQNNHRLSTRAPRPRSDPVGGHVTRWKLYLWCVCC